MTKARKSVMGTVNAYQPKFDFDRIDKHTNAQIQQLSAPNALHADVTAQS